MVTQNVARYPPHNMTYTPAKFEAATSNSLGGYNLQENALFDLVFWVMVTQNIAQYPLHHVTYASAKFEVAKFNSLRKICIYKKIHYFTFDHDFGVKVI